MSDKNQVAIKVSSVSKSFKLPHEKNTTVKGALVNLFNSKKKYEKQEVLKNINFEIKKGEFFGIVGRNGSGKSTLLKLLAGIYSPDTGGILVNGKLTPFIELGVGFNPELTGRENVYLNGALLGFSRKEMSGMYNEIVEFAELEKFMDQKLKNYSSGMQVRLAFSIAIRAKSDVLLIDEVLAVGDTAFQRKCYEHFVLLKKQNRTVVLVTHDMGAVERFCDKAMVIKNGEIKGILSPRKASVLYDELNSNAKTTNRTKHSGKRWGSQEVVISSIKIKGKDSFIGKTTHKVTQGENLVFKINLRTKDKVPKKIVIGMAFFNESDVNVSGPNSIGEKIYSNETITYEIPRMPLNPGTYKATIIVFDDDVVNEYDHIEEAFKLEVVSNNHRLHGVVNLFGNWSKGESD